MSDFERNEFAMDDLSLDELIRSAKEDLARADARMAPQSEVEEEVILQEEPQEEPQEELIEEQISAPEYIDAAEDTVQEERFHLPAGIRVFLYVCCVLAASVLLAVGAWTCADDVLALTKPERVVTITIEDNASIADVTQMLKDEDLIRYEWLFQFYCWFSHAERKIDAGTYELNNLYDYHALVNGMISTSGDRASVKVTIPEGYECADIFALLEESGVCSVSQLERTAASYPFEYDFLAERPYGDSNRLEGYLFPDTYEFFLGDKPENVINKFLRNFERKLTDELLAQIDAVNSMISEKMEVNGFEPEQIQNSQLNLHDIITIASLVEKETAKTSESASIASVIYNRLCSKLYPCLQIDATIQYALTERKEQLSNADKAVISPYNTYTNAGLPAGPIANPGLNSIRAALYPAQTEYYFYALGREGTHKFSVTYYEHQEFLTETEQSNDAP